MKKKTVTIFNPAFHIFNQKVYSHTIYINVFSIYLSLCLSSYNLHVYPTKYPRPFSSLYGGLGLENYQLINQSINQSIFSPSPSTTRSLPQCFSIALPFLSPFLLSAIPFPYPSPPLLIIHSKWQYNWGKTVFG